MDIKGRVTMLSKADEGDNQTIVLCVPYKPRLWLAARADPAFGALDQPSYIGSVFGEDEQ